MLEMKILWTLILFPIAAVMVALLWASTTSLKKGIHNQPIVGANKKTLMEPVTKLNVMTWNIGFAYGMGSEGVNYQKLTAQEMQQKLDEVSDVIGKHRPDVVLLQEVDFDSARSHNVDQLKYIAEQNGYKYYAYAITWDNNYIPFPYWPIKNQFGKMNSGGGILSRFPIKENQVHLHVKPQSNPFWYNMFYLFRFTQLITVEINDKPFVVINNHLEAFDKETRQYQAAKLAHAIHDVKKNKENFLAIGGDFNTTPPNAVKKSKFEGYAEDNYEEDKTYTLVSQFPFLQEVVNLDEYAQDEKKWFTFSSVKPERRLDYLFVGEYFKVLSTEIIQSQASDHLPVLTNLELNANSISLPDADQDKSL
jgi:endonuclease/exonuclease/phosphatase family metal-dependent hydrolase